MQIIEYFVNYFGKLIQYKNLKISYLEALMKLSNKDQYLSAEIALLIFCLISFLSIPGYGQNQTDSLKNLLRNAVGDKKTELLLELSSAYLYLDANQSLEYGTKALELSRQSNNKLLIAKALDALGQAYFNKKDFPKAVDYLKQSKAIYKELDMNKKVALANQNIGTAYMQSAAFDEAEKYMLLAIQYFKDKTQQGDLAFTYLNLGLTYYYKGEYSEAMDCYDQALNIYSKQKNSVNYSKLLNRIAMTYRSLGINDKALQYVMESTGLKADDDYKGKATGYNNIGAIYRDLDEPDKAIQYYRKALDAYVLTGDTVDMPSVLTNIGTVLYNQGNIDSALYYYNKSLKISETIGNKILTAKTKYNMALIYDDQGRKDLAVSYMKEFYNISVETGYKEGEAYALIGLGDIYLKDKAYTKAGNYYREAISIADSIHQLQILESGYSSMSELMGNTGDKGRELEYFKKYIEVKDSLINTEKTRTITEMETRYELEKRLHENELLSKDNELKSRQIKMLYIVSGALVILILTVISLIILFRKNTLNKRKLVESESERLSEKLEYQNRELTTSALALSRNLTLINKLLEDIKQLSSLVSEPGLPLLMKITRDLGRLDSDAAWKEFELRFENVYNEFYDNLFKRFPTLTNNEMRLCAFLKLGMSTKEISSITFQSIRAIEAARLRLRKKLELENSEDLNTFLQQF